MNEQTKAAETAAREYWTIATSEDPEVSHYRSPQYRTAQIKLLKAIAAAYPQVCASDVLDAFQDFGESIAECAKTVRENGRYTDPCKPEVYCPVCRYIR